MAWIISNTTGRHDSKMIATIVAAKFSCTAGIVPKKYPRNMNSPTQTAAPTTLKKKNLV